MAKLIDINWVTVLRHHLYAHKKSGKKITEQNGMEWIKIQCGKSQ